MEEKTRQKRKTKTSTEVKRRYNAKHYKKFQADIKTEDFERLANYIQHQQISKAEFLRMAINALCKK